MKLSFVIDNTYQKTCLSFFRHERLSFFRKVSLIYFLNRNTMSNIISDQSFQKHLENLMGLP